MGVKVTSVSHICADTTFRIEITLRYPGCMQIVYQTAVPLIVLLSVFITSVAPAVAGGDARLDLHHGALDDCADNLSPNNDDYASRMRPEILAVC